jgi:RNA polymerase sigma-70 factor (sigma-E family)
MTLAADSDVTLHSRPARPAAGTAPATSRPSETVRPARAARYAGPEETFSLVGTHRPADGRSWAPGHRDRSEHDVGSGMAGESGRSGDEVAGPAEDGSIRTGPLRGRPVGDGPAGDQTAADQTAADRAAAAESEFETFFAEHHRELARLAYLLTGEREAADDITADAFTSAWSRWEHVCSADSPVAYLRRTVANLATNRLRRIVRERRCLSLLGGLADGHAADPDVSAALDVRRGLMALPARKRQCVVLRYAFDLSEDETARTLGVSVGTVKSQTSKGIRELERLLGTGPAAPQRRQPRRDAPRPLPLTGEAT